MEEKAISLHVTRQTKKGKTRPVLVKKYLNFLPVGFNPTRDKRSAYINSDDNTHTSHIEYFITFYFRPTMDKRAWTVHDGLYCKHTKETD